MRRAAPQGLSRLPSGLAVSLSSTCRHPGQTFPPALQRGREAEDVLGRRGWSDRERRAISNKLRELVSRNE
jgi:hypothetical protein